jgi:sugar phosphate isomerase/epimerase
MFNMAHPDADHRVDGLRRLEAVATSARAMGADAVGLCTGTRSRRDMWRGHRDNTTAGAWRDLRETMDAALEIADRADVTLLVECEPANVVRDARAGRRLLDEVGHPRLRIVMDPANIVAGDRERPPAAVLDEAFGLLGPDIVAAHAKDIDGAGRFCACGTGVVPWGRVVAGLRGVGFDGPLVLHSLVEAQVPSALATLRMALG